MIDVTKWALDQRVVAFVLFFLLAVSGLSAYQALPRAEDPGFVVRQAIIITEFPGANAQRVEELVTDRLEEGLQKLPGLDFIQSVSRPGQSVITVSAQETLRDVEGFWDEMRERVAEQARLLPAEAVGPFVNDDFGDVFGTLLAVTGDGFNLAELEKVADRLRTHILRVKDVAKVELVGVGARRIFLEFDEARLAELGVATEQIAEQLQARNIVDSSGRVAGADRVFEIQTDGSFQNLDELAGTLIRVGRSSLPLRELVSIRAGYEDEPPAPSMSFLGRPAVGLAISMAPGGKLTVMAPSVLERVDRLVEDLPVGIEVHVASYQAAVVEVAVGDFVENLYQSVAIVLLVMLVALGLRTGLIIGLMVPMTIFATFSVMGFMRVGIDKMSLTALIIALGLLVDNGIVMAESILVRRAAGEGPLEAALQSARELRGPLLISSVTTVAALLPTYLAESTTGEYTAPIATVVGVALILSWVLSLTFIPLLCVAFPGRAEVPAQSKETRVSARYRALLVSLIRYRKIALAGFVLVFIGSAALMGRVPQQFFAGKDWPQFTIELDLPEGTPRARTSEVVADIERFLIENYLDADFEAKEASEKLAGKRPRAERGGLLGFSAFVGQGAVRFILGYTPEQPKESYAYFIVNAENYERMGPILDEVGSYIEERFPEATARILPLRNGPPLQYPVEVRLLGDDIDELRRAVEKTEDKLRSIPGLVRIGNDWGPARPQVEVRIDPLRLQAAGLSHADVASSLDTAFRGSPLTVLRDGNTLVPIVLRRQRALSASVGDIESRMLKSRSGEATPLLQVAEVEVGFEPLVIRRRDRQRTITVRADLAEDAPRDLTPFSVAAALRPWLDGQEGTWPFGHGWAFGGEVESSGTANASIEAKQPVAIILILLCLVMQFNTFREPLIVVLTLPFAITGVAIGLYVTQKPFGFMALLGVIALFGIVINNAIVLLDRAQTEVRAGRSKLDAIVEASVGRLRPILLTTATTVAGLIPLAVSGGPLFSPMAVALMSGLLVGTGLTLGLVPVLYALLHRLPRPGVAAVALAVLSFGLSTEAQARPLTEDEAAKIAAQRALSVEEAEAELRAARAREFEATAGFWPRLSGLASYTRLSDIEQPSLFGPGFVPVVTQAPSGPLAVSDLTVPPPGQGAFPVLLDQWFFTATLSVPISRYLFELSDSLTVAGEGVEAQRLLVAVARVHAASTARLAYCAVEGATLELRVFEQRLEEAAERLRVAERRFEAQAIAETDVLEAKSALARARLAKAQAETRVALSSERLRQVLRAGSEDNFELELRPAGTIPSPEPEALAALEAEAEARRLELRSAKRRISALEAAEGLAHRSAFPRLEANFGVVAANPNPRFIPNLEEFDATWEAGFRLSWSPNDIALAAARQSGAEAARAAAETQLEGLRLSIRQAVVRARQGTMEAAVAIETSRRGLEAAEGSYQRRKLSFEEGAATVLDVLQSESARLAAELDVIQAERRARTALIQLENATGRDIEPVLAN